MLRLAVRYASRVPPRCKSSRTSVQWIRSIALASVPTAVSIGVVALKQVACDGASVPRCLPADVCPRPSSGVEKAKRLAARRAVDEEVQSGMCIGVGSGSTVVYAVQRLAERYWSRKTDEMHLSAILLAECGLPLGDLSTCPELDICVDGADEVSPTLDLIKGGGACQTQEKLVAASSKRFVVIADYRKKSKQLGTEWRNGVPLEVIPEGYAPVMRTLARMGGKPVLRMAQRKAGPVVTDNGNFVIDVDFDGISDPAGLHVQLAVIPGVVETGLFPAMASRALFGEEDGSVSEWQR